jgi:hypothetical protein
VPVTDCLNVDDTRLQEFVDFSKHELSPSEIT